MGATQNERKIFCPENTYSPDNKGKNRHDKKKVKDLYNESCV